MFIFMHSKQYSADLYPTDNLWVTAKRKLRDPPTQMNAASKATWAWVTSEQSHGPNASTPRCTEAAAHAKEAQTNTECIELNILFKS